MNRPKAKVVSKLKGTATAVPKQSRKGQKNFPKGFPNAGSLKK